MQLQRTKNNVPGDGGEVVPVAHILPHHVTSVAVASWVHRPHIQLVSKKRTGCNVRELSGGKSSTQTRKKRKKIHVRYSYEKDRTHSPAVARSAHAPVQPTNVRLFRH